jgi:hypothetical protein
MGRPRLEVSAVQVVATVLAAVTGALLASYLGVVGTIAGTAVASGASTMATAVYRHYLGRTRDRFHEVRAHRTEPESAGETATAPPVGEASPATRQEPVQPTRRQPAVTDARVPTFTAARVATFTPHGDKAGQGKPADRGRPASVDGADRTQVMGAASRFRTWRGQLWNRRVLVRYWLPALAAFVLVTGGITGFGLAAGKPVSSVVWGKSGSGTSAGSAVTGGSSSGSTTKHTTTNPSGQPSSDASTATRQASPSTSATPTTGPSASSSTAATPDASPSAAVTSSASSTTAAGNNRTGG